MWWVDWRLQAESVAESTAGAAGLQDALRCAKVAVNSALAC